MSRYYNVHLTPSSTSPGPYTIYWNTVSSGSIATIFSTSLPATGLTLTQLISTNGVNIIVPDSTTQIIISNPKCPPFYIEALPTEEVYDFCMNILIPDVSTDTYPPSPVEPIFTFDPPAAELSYNIAPFTVTRFNKSAGAVVPIPTLPLSRFTIEPVVIVVVLLNLVT